MAQETHSARRINSLLDASQRRINRLLETIGGERRYLEVGVATGRTFTGIEARRKVAVDPRFRFDYKPLANALTSFHEIPSDEYFTKFAAGEQFDVIFLDGLHTFEQTFRDFCACMSHCGPNAAIVIDDTVPSDIYSSWRVGPEAVAFRKQEGGCGKEWHGDVFKVVFAIHDFFPTHTYVTAGDGGNPQTIVWRQPRANFEPLFNNLDTITRMTWFELQKNRAIMNICSEEEALERATAGLRAASNPETAARAIADAV